MSNRIAPPPPRRRRRRRTGSQIRPVLRIVGAVALVALVVAAVIFIGVKQRKDSPTPKSIESVLDYVQVSGRIGSTPALVLSQPISVASMKYAVAVTGDGREIVADGPVMLSISTYSGQTGEYIGNATSSGHSGAMTTGNLEILVRLAHEGELRGDLAGMIIGQKEGTRLVAVRPTAEGETEINVIDILWTTASGVPVEDSPGPLTITYDNGFPVFTHSDVDPTELVVQTLIQGDGAQVAAGDTVVIKYVSAQWETSEIVSSTWGEVKPDAIGLDSAMKGLRDALIDQRVGTRLAVTIPSTLANGDDNIMMIVDILETAPTA